MVRLGVRDRLKNLIIIAEKHRAARRADRAVFEPAKYEPTAFEEVGRAVLRRREARQMEDEKAVARLGSDSSSSDDEYDFPTRVKNASRPFQWPLPINERFFFVLTDSPLSPVVHPVLLCRLSA